MKFTKLLLPLVCSCIGAQANPVISKLHGIITNPIGDSIKVAYTNTDVEYKPVTYGAAIAKDGSFNLEFPLTDRYTLISIDHGNQESEIIMEPGDDLTMKLDANNFDSTLHYEGKGHEIANFVEKHVLDIGMLLNNARQVQPLYLKEPKDFNDALVKLDSVEYALIARNQRGVSPAFINYWMAILKYRDFTSLLHYPAFHEVMKQQSYSARGKKEDMAIISYVPEAFNDNFLSIPYYQIYIDEVYYMKVRTNSDDPFGDAIQKTADSMADEKVKAKMPHGSSEFYFAQQLVHGAKYYSTEETEKRFTAFKKGYPGSKYMATLESTVALKEKLSKGRPALDFDITTPEGNKMKLSDLKGKVVYLDFWASWCGPCKAEFPHAKEIHEHFKDQPVAFVYVSIDDDTANWHKAIKQFGIEGIHTCSPGNFKSGVAIMYGVEGIPAYFLIDKTGNFALDVTPRPSSGKELTADIDTLLK